MFLVFHKLLSAKSIDKDSMSGLRKNFHSHKKFLFLICLILKTDIGEHDITTATRGNRKYQSEGLKDVTEKWP